MAFKLTTVKEAAVESGIKILVYGAAGAGKTVLCTTCEDPIIISAESGLLSAGMMLHKQNMDDIPVIEIQTADDLEQAYHYCATGEGRKYRTICLDSLTEIAEQILAKAKKSVSDGRQAYGLLNDRCVQIIKMFRDLKGRDVYFSAKSSEKEDASGAFKIAPHMPGSTLRTELAYLFDEVFYLGVGIDEQTKQTFRYLRTQPDFKHTAKDRSACLDLFEPAHIAQVIDKIRRHVPAAAPLPSINDEITPEDIFATIPQPTEQ